jgi:hypothetical protein
MASAVRELEPLHGDEERVRQATRIATGNERLSPVDQLDIYREQFWLRHVGVLEEDFLSIVTLLGHDGFHELARAYLTACPPRSFSLRDLGDRLAEFVSTSERYREDGLLADLARLEWCFVEAFDAPDAPPLDPQTIASASETDWPGAIVVLHPSVQRITMRYPAHQFRAAARARASEGGDPVPRPEPSPVCLVVYRGEEKLHYIDIEPAAFALLEALASQLPLERACEEAARVAGIDDASALEPHIGAWFQQWTSLGWVSEVRF